MSARPTLLGIPYDASSSYLRGSAQAPNLIRRALASLSSNGWSESLRDASSIHDAGDIGVSGDNPRALISAAADAILDGILATVPTPR